MLFYVIIVILLFLIYYFSASSPKKMRYIHNVYSTNNSNKICGKKSLYCKGNLIRPYMFRNLSKQYVSNEYVDWNIEAVDTQKNLYNMKLADNYCAYNHNDDICLYQLKEDSNDNKPGCKKTNLCGIDSILGNEVHYDSKNSAFIIKEMGLNQYTIQTQTGSYVCNLNNRMGLSNALTEDCIWEFK